MQEENNKSATNKRVDKKSIVILVITLFVLGAMMIVGPIVMIISCQQEYKGYSGKYPELFTVAIESVPNAKGYLNGEITHEPVLCLIEQDDYGRKMFCYMDSDYNDGKDIPIYLLVCQTRIDEQAYYYADHAWVMSHVVDYPSRVKHGGTGHTSWIKEPLKDFSEEQIAKLKEDNDWGKQLNLDKCVSAKIVRKKTKSKLTMTDSSRRYACSE